jgi:hypothetical protein
VLELHIDNKDVSSGSVKVGWCVSKDTLTKLFNEGIKDPQLILVLAPTGDAYRGDKEVRKVIPLKDLFTYLEFRFSGTHTLWGFIGTDLSHKTAKGSWLSMGYERFSRVLLSQDGSEATGHWADIHPEPRYNFIVEKTTTPLTIDIPSEAFAKEPSPFVSNWVNHLFMRAPENQCDFRRRFLLSIAVQPILFLLDLFPKILITLFSLLTGQRSFNLQYLFDPFSHFFGNKDNEPFGSGTIFIGKGESTFWNWARLPLMPMIWLPLVIIGKLLVAHGKLMGLLAILGLGIAAIVGVLSFIILICLINYHYEKWQEKRQPWYLQQDEMDLIVCSAGMNKPYSLGDLPSNKRTIKMRYSVLKNAVCKPFAR